MATFEEKCESMSLRIKRAGRSEELEIVLKSSTRVKVSPNTFAVGDLSEIVNALKSPMMDWLL